MAEDSIALGTGISGSLGTGDGLQTVRARSIATTGSA